MFYILLLQDLIEIMFYACIIYTFCLWLKTDKTKNILPYFLAYSTTIVIAWWVELPTLAPILCTYAPIALILFIILHEKTLQRNLVTLQAITPVHTLEDDWLDIALGSILTTINNNKSVTAIIENKDSLDYFLTTPLSINAELHKGILNLLLSSAAYDEHKMIWLTRHGYIRGINASWSTGEPQQSLLTNNHIFNKKDALFYTLQSDAIIIYIHPHLRTFTLIAHGKETQHIPSNAIKNSINKHLSLHTSLHNKGKTHESHTAEKPLS